MTPIKPIGKGGPRPVRISLCDRSEDVARALGCHFRDADDAEVLAGDLLDLDCDALVSPTNSFGDMSGGIDRSIDLFYDGAAQRLAMGRIAERFRGELPVGSATILEMGTSRFGHLILAPTMRVPSRVSGTLNAYLAMRAALSAVLDHNAASPRPIRSVAIPGLGTGVGGMTPDESARQMRAAYDMILLEGWKQIAHPVQAPFALGPDHSWREASS